MRNRERLGRTSGNTKGFLMCPDMRIGARDKTLTCDKLGGECLLRGGPEGSVHRGLRQHMQIEKTHEN